MEEKKIYEIKNNDAGRRIDRIIRKMFPLVTLSSIYKALRKGDIRLNNNKIKPNATAHMGDILSVHPSIAETEKKDVKELSVVDINQDKQFIKALILYENDNILAINKPAGLVVHGADSLEEKVKTYLTSGMAASLSFEPGPVHRIDRNTSGLIFFSKSLKGAQVISEIFQKNQCDKYYLGLFEGIIEHEVEWKDSLARDKNNKKTYASQKPGAKPAITLVKPLLYAHRKTLALCLIKTGITHQIRAQGMIHGFPLVGDKKYGSMVSSEYSTHYILHAWGVRFLSFHKIIGRTTVFAPLPRKMHKKLTVFFGANTLKDTLAGITRNVNRSTGMSRT